MEDATSKGFSGGHVDTFLEKIATDRDRELQAIAGELQREIVHLRRAAYQESRRFFRQQAGQAREQQQYSYERRLSRARTVVRRQRWQLLLQLQARVMSGVQQRLEQAWREPQAQRTWCEHWLRAAIDHAEGAPLLISLGAGSLAATQTLIETLAAQYPAGSTVSRPAGRAPGIIIEWDGTLLDGSLAGQLAQAEETVFTALNLLLHDEQTGPGGIHGHG